MTFTSFWPGRILDRAGSGRTGEAPVSTWAVAPAADSRFLRPFRRYRGCKGRRNDKGLGEGETFMAVKDEDPEAESEVVEECITGKKKSKFEEYREAWECFEEEAAAIVKAKKTFTTRDTLRLRSGRAGGHRVNLCLQLLGAQAEKDFAQAWVTLGLAEVRHFAGRAFRADDFDELIFFRGGPTWE